MFTAFTLFLVVGLAGIAFPHPLQYIINRALNGAPAKGTRILTRQEFIDVDTGEQFFVWQGANGVKVWLASLILKI